MSYMLPKGHKTTNLKPNISVVFVAGNAHQTLGVVWETSCKAKTERLELFQSEKQYLHRHKQFNLRSAELYNLCSVWCSLLWLFQ